MKILVVSDTYLPLVGGAEVHVDELVRHLRAAGHQVRLFVTEPKTVPGETQITRVAWHRNFGEVFGKLWNDVASFKPDVIAAHYSYRLAAVAGVVAKLKNVPMTVTLHGLGTLPEAHAGFRSRLQVWLYRHVSLACATHVIATSQDMLDAVPWVTHKTTIIPNGADASRFDPSTVEKDPVVAVMRQKAAGRPVILTVRRLNPKCGIQYLVEAMPEIVKRHPDVLYLMVGTGRMDDEIRARIKQLGLERNIEMVGLVQNPDVPKWFAIADVVVFPSTAESTSISCIEAMLMGKAVVSSAVGGLIELLGRDGSRGKLVKLVDGEHSDYEAPPTHGIPTERYTALAKAISDLLYDQGARDRVGAAARAYALENFSWNIVTKKTTTIYKKCTGTSESYRLPGYSEQA